MRRTSDGSDVVNRPPRNVVAVSGDAQRTELMDLLLEDGTAHDVIFVESIARGYSRIKQVEPDVIVVLLEAEDVGGCHLLSMLTIDRETRHIPLVTWTTRRERTDFADIVATLDRQSSFDASAIQMN